MFTPQARMLFEAPIVALERWNPAIVAAAPADETTINIYSTIGEYGDGQGMTAKMVNNILRRADGRAIHINMNSPGGDFFEGNAIFNLLKEYKGEVNVRVVGLSASAASIVAMGADNIEIAQSAFFMIHNAWTVQIGNRHDMQKTADTLVKFDAAMADIYVEKTGIKSKDINKMLDAETWISGVEAVEQGFAHALLASDEIALDESPQAQHNASLKKVDVALAKAGLPRSQRRSLLEELLTSKPGAAAVDKTPMPGAGTMGEALQALLKSTQK